MAAPSKTVCLRAFNKDLGGTNPWDRQAPTPPPLPKRIAWPGGKIVSNKDEALASFLRRKLDQGQTLTPEQMAMLEKMVTPNAPRSAEAAARTTTTNSAGGKRKARGAGYGYGGGGEGSADARNLLHKLERKVAGATDPFKATSGGGGVRRVVASSMSSNIGRRKIDLSSLKRGGAMTAGGSGTGGAGAARRILADGRGGFTIATVSTAAVSSKADFFDLSAGIAETAVPGQPHEGTSNKRPRGVGGGWLDTAPPSLVGDGNSNVVGVSGLRSGHPSGLSRGGGVRHRKEKRRQRRSGDRG